MNAVRGCKLVHGIPATGLKLLLMGLCLIMATSCRETPPDLDDPNLLLARVGDTEITRGQVEEAQDTAGGRETPAESLDRLIRRAALVEQARIMELKENPEVRRAMENVLIRELRQEELEPLLEQIVVNEADLRAVYERELESMSTPERRRLAILVVGDEERAEWLGRLRQEELPSAATGFGELAYRYSAHERSRYQGGDLGWLEQGALPESLPDDLLRAGFQLREVGELSGLIALEEGWGRVRLMEREATSTPSMDEVREMLESMVLREKRDQVQRDFQRQAMEAAGVDLYHREVIEEWKDDASDSAPPEVP